MTPTLLHSFSKPASTSFRNLVRAEGVRIWDDQGNEYIDAMASLWYCQVGHGRSEIIDAITRQLRQLSTYHTFDPWTNAAADQLAERIVQVSPFDQARVFLCNSGSEAIDTAIKLVRLVAELRDGEQRQIILRRGRGYHGANMGGTSIQGIETNRQHWGDLLPHVIEIDADDIDSLSETFAEFGDKIAGVICEPVQGAGGVFPPADGYLQRLRGFCDKHGALLVFDEVITGFGRTGNWFASQTYGVEPDLITFAKGVSSGYQAVGGVIIKREISNVLEADREFVLRHGYTYSGHPVAAAAALANIDLIEKEGLVARADRIGTRMRSGLQRLTEEGLLSEFRGLAGIWAARLPLDSPDGRNAVVRDKMLDLGVISRPLGDVIAFCPPLVIDDDDIDQCVDALGESLRLVP